MPQMGSSKQNKKSSAKSSSNSTLLDFFSRKGPSTPSSSATQNTKPKRQKSHSSISTFQEVIVIESDSGEEQTYKRVGDKRRRLSKARSPQEKENGASTFISKIKTEGTRSVAFDDKLSCIPETSIKYPSFGTPTLLLQSSDAPTLSFGKPSHLLAPIQSIPLEACSSSSKVDNAVSSGSCTTNLSEVDIDLTIDGSGSENGNSEVKPGSVKATTQIDVDMPLDNLWETGDDETEAVSNEVSNMVEDAAVSEPVLQECPICSLESTGLSEVEFQAHINVCLDSQSVETSILESTACKPCSSRVKPTPNSTNAFTKLKESMAENEAWNELNTERKGGPKGKGSRRTPFYKVLQGMPIAVDAFCYGNIPGVTAYFLTHAHSDHYTNLSSKWKHGPIYCSQGTANLIIHMLSVDPKWVHPLPMDTPTIIPSTNSVSVTLIEANHCPGSSLFFFEGPQTVHAGDSNFKSHFVGSSRIFRYLHCGDFRATPQHVLHPCIKGKKIDHVYLDTTYLDPKYTFPPQTLVISACAEMAKRLVTKQPLKDSKSSVGTWLKLKQPEVAKPASDLEKVLVVVGTYSIGKERVVKAIANALNSKVYCDKKKAEILRCQADSELDALLTSDPLEATVHLAPLGIINVEGLTSYMRRYKDAFTKSVGFRPTGWCFTPSTGSATQMLPISSILSKTRQQNFSHEDLRPTRCGTIQLIPVPYSEHSSFTELTCFAMSLDWLKMIPTVNVGSESSRKKMSTWIGKWEAERKKRGETSIVPHRHPEYW